VAISDVQFRISQIHSFMTTAAVAPATQVSRAGLATGATAGVTETAGAQFAAVLDQTLAAGATAAPADTTMGTQPAAQSAGWTLPTQGTVSSEFGPRWGRQHQGVDIAAGTGTAVGAAADGVVREASWRGGYGKAVVIDHGNGVSTLYGHNSELLVRPGDRVQAGQLVAKVGSTGDSTGPHLHFEVVVDGKKVDPRPWLEQRGVKF
jgi:murein DD-endopeptidase MepM/ murein hydrolase activator NlpD